MNTVDKTCSKSTFCPITINAWNEWSEGSYLEPDTRFGMQKLKAIGEVFGPVPNRTAYFTLFKWPLFATFPPKTGAFWVNLAEMSGSFHVNWQQRCVEGR